MTDCLCCQLPAAGLNPLGLCADCAVCQHCDERPTVDLPAGEPLGLCAACYGQADVRALYGRREKPAAVVTTAPGVRICLGTAEPWSPEREQHLRRKTREFQCQLVRRLIEYGHD